ncbi:uncharacterized serine-rich protein C215.13-like [Gigantopelta aegis]|uniref:uncharacterized serine-rich protein C215.13-like n=1 Tax=Gigantopelta aegis TaxID=1735272 RepID=UPI001B88CCE8|nr:uncharacterized serine-rich protein C215.13-like [Gigantopelta aegis]
MILAALAVAVFTQHLSAAFSSCHNGCSCLKNVAVCSEMTSLDSLSVPVHTTTLVLDSLKLQTVPADAFKSLGPLRILELQNCTIERIEKGAFRGLGNMEEIIIARSNISSINRKAFSDMHDITRLTFSGNVIRSVGQDAFYNITNVTEITFQSNTFTNIAHHAFHHIKWVKFLHFYLNTVTGTVKAGGFAGMHHFDTVNFYLNNIKIMECRTLDRLVLSGKKVSIYSNVFKCHCKLSWMHSQVSMKSYLSSNLCTNNGDPQQLFLSKAKTADLHCPSAKPTSKQRGCPNGKTDHVIQSTSATTRKKATKLPSYRHTMQMEFHGTRMTWTARKTSTESYGIDTSSMSSPIEASENISNQDIESLITSQTSSKLPTTSSTVTVNTISSTSPTSIAFTTPPTTQKLITPQTSSTLPTTEYTVTVKTISSMSQAAVTFTTKPTAQKRITLFTTKPTTQMKKSLTSPVSRSSSSVTKFTTEASTTTTSAINMIISLTSQTSKMPSSITKPVTKMVALSTSSTDTSSKRKHAPKFTHSFRSTKRKKLSKKKMTSLKRSTSTATSTALVTDEPRISPIVTSMVQTPNGNFRKYDRKTKSTVKDRYEQSPPGSAGHVFIADSGSLPVALYLIMTFSDVIW